MLSTVLQSVASAGSPVGIADRHDVIMVDSSNSFQIADYAIFGVTIAISISIGIYYALSGSRQRTTSEYLVGGRTMKFLPVAISLVVSFESSIMMLGMPAETYVHGIQLWICLFSYIAAHILAIFVVVPLLHPLRITSAYEVSVLSSLDVAFLIRLT